MDPLAPSQHLIKECREELMDPLDQDTNAAWDKQLFGTLLHPGSSVSKHFGENCCYSPARTELGHGREEGSNQHHAICRSRD